MLKLNLVPGSKEWLDVRLNHFTASEAPAMMGVHKQISRTQLLDHKKGWIKDVDDFTQKLFDAGHATEEMARPLAEEMICDDLFVTVGVLEGTKFLASFDGLTLFYDVAFEHKLYNKALAENVKNGVLEPHYYWQLEHQLLVSGADRVLFVVSDGTPDNFESMFYTPVEGRREELLAGWAQFEKDLADHVPAAKEVKVVAEKPADLPVVRYELNGLQLTSNVDEYLAAAQALVEKSKARLETDQQFADADARGKVFVKAESNIEDLKKSVLSEIADVAEFVDKLDSIKALIREARLSEAKQVKTRKDEIRNEIANEAMTKGRQFAEELFAPLKLTPPAPSVSITEAMKGKRTLESLRDAADSALAEIKIELERLAGVAGSNLEILKAEASKHKFLFSDWKEIAFKDPADFLALVKLRIADYAAEQQRIENEKAEAEKLAATKKAEAEATAQSSQKSDFMVPPKRDAQKAVSPAVTFEPKEVKQVLSTFAEREILRGVIADETIGELVIDDNGNEYDLEITIKRVSIQTKRAA